MTVYLEHDECCLMEIPDPKTVVWSLWDTCWHNEFLRIGEVNHFEGQVTYAKELSWDYIVNNHCNIGYSFFIFRDQIVGAKEGLWV